MQRKVYLDLFTCLKVVYLTAKQPDVIILLHKLNQIVLFNL